MKQIPYWVWFAIIGFMFAAMLLSTQLVQQPKEAKISYSEFKQTVLNGDIKEVTLDGDKASALLSSPKKFGATTTDFERVSTITPASGDPDLIKLLEKNNIIIWNRPLDDGIGWLKSIVPWFVLFGVYIFFLRRMQGNVMDRFGGRNSQDFLVGSSAQEEKTERKVTFDDVAGQEGAKREVAELVDFLKHPQTYENVGAEPPRGVLLMGAPGTGKTLLARALAGEAGVNFFHISASEFIEMFVGVGASRVRKMFEEAKKRAPSIIFIDELDAVGRARGTGFGGGNDEREQTLNQILSEMDGFSGHEAVIVLAATNRPDVLDPALLRPGRFDRHVTLDLPDKTAREQILKVHVRKVPLAKEVNLATVAASCPGFSGADLKNLVNEAAIAAARNGVDEVTTEHFDTMRDKIIMGTVRTLAIQPEEHKRLAVHEAGHTAVAFYSPNADPLYKVTIIPRGRALGATHMLPGEERHTLDENYLLDQLAIILAGRVGEQIFMGNVSSGADDDIKRATQLARSMVSRWGMSKDIGPIDLSQSEEHPFLGREIAQPKRFSEAMSNKVDEAVSKLLKDAEQSAVNTITDHKSKIEVLFKMLEKEETVSHDQITEILS